MGPFEFTSPLYYLLIVALLVFAIAPLLTRATPEDWFATQGRFVALDGLRGLLAISVFLHHSAITHVYLTTGEWKWPESPFYAHLGSGGVVLFFFLTGFLFFRLFVIGSSKWDAKVFFRRRFFRLAPAFYLAMGAVAASCFVLGEGPVSSPAELAGELGSWLIFGLPFGEFLNLNSQALTLIVIAGVIWSIRWEWIFYLFFPWLRKLRTLNSLILFLICATAVRWLLARPEVSEWVAANPFWEKGHRFFLDAGRFFVLNFGIGMVAASLSVNERMVRLFSTPAAFVAGIAALLTEVFLPLRYYSYPVEAALLGIFFVQVCLNPERWGFLQRRSLRLLGDVSYGVYLFHGINLFWIFRWATSQFGDTVRTEPLIHWGLAAVAGVLTVLEAYASYRWIEKPAMKGTRYFTP